MNKIVLYGLVFMAVSAEGSAAESYILLSAGQSKFDLNKSDFDNIYRSTAPFSSTLKASDKSFKAEAGFRINPSLAIEFGFVNLGKANYNIHQDYTGAPFFGGNSYIRETYRASGLALGVVGTVPISESVSLFGKAGLVRTNVDVEAVGEYLGIGGTKILNESRSGVGGNFSIGANWKFSKRLGMLVEIERFSGLPGASNIGSKFNSDMLSAGLVIGF